MFCPPSSHRKKYEFLPAGGHALFSPAVGTAHFFFSRRPRITLFWASITPSRCSRPSVIHHVVLVLRCPTTLFSSLRHALREPSARPRADPRVLLRTLSLTCCARSGGLPAPPSAPSARCACRGCVSRARLATVSSAWSWIPPCHVWSTFVRRWERLVAGATALKVCTAKSAPFIRLCSALFPAIVHSAVLVRRVPLRSPGQHGPVEPFFSSPRSGHDFQS